MAASAGGLDAQPLTGAQPTGGLRRDLLTADEVAPGGAVAAALGAPRPRAPPLGDQRVGHALQRPDPADDAAPAAMGAVAAGAPADRVLDDAQRELEPERLHRRVERVGHGDVNAARPV